MAAGRSFRFDRYHASINRFARIRANPHAVHLGAATLLRISAEGLATALVLVVHARTGHAATAGFVQTAVMLPYVLSGPVTGDALDRTLRPRTVILTMAGFYVVAAAALLLAAGNVPLVVAILIAAVVGCTEPVVVALTALLPRYVPEHRLTRAYGLEASTYNLAAIAGPGMAAGLAAWAGAGYAACAVIASAALGLLMLPLLVVPPPGKRLGNPKPQPNQPEGGFFEPNDPEPNDPEPNDPEPNDLKPNDPEPNDAEPSDSLAGRWNREPSESKPDPGPDRRIALPRVLDVVAGGLVALVANRVLRAVTVATTLAFLGWGGLAVTAVLLAEHRGASASVGGQLLAMFALGALIGSLSAARWLSARIAEWVLLAGMVAFGVALLSVAVAPSVPVVAACFLIAGICDGPVFAATLTVRQREAPPERLGQVNTTGGSLKIGSAALGAALTGALADHLGPVGLLACMAVCHFAGALLGLLLLTVRRGGRDRP